MKNLYCLLILILSACGGSGSNTNSEYKLITEASNLAFPARLAELPSGKLLIAEVSSGNLTIFDRKTKNKEILKNFQINLNQGVSISGLLVDKNFSNNGFVYIYHGENGFNVLTRLTIKDDKILTSEKLNTFAISSGHNGGGLLQLDNSNILLGTGDSGTPDQAQNRSSLAGKIILLDSNGQILDPNYAIGLRNPFGISGIDEKILVLDNGPDCDDEINLLTQNSNFAWRKDYQCMENNPNYTQAIYRWQTSEGTTDLLYSEKSELSGKILAARYNTKTISILDFDGQALVEEQILFANGSHGQFIDILETDAGEILLSSQDGNVYLIKSE